MAPPDVPPWLVRAPPPSPLADVPPIPLLPPLPTPFSERSEISPHASHDQALIPMVAAVRKKIAKETY
jgi:hypothetical protein